MTELSALGVTVELPTGWEGRIFRRPEFGDPTATADDPAAPPGATTHSVVHLSTISLPTDVGDFASGAVDLLGPDDALIVLFEYDASSVDQPLFAVARDPEGPQPRRLQHAGAATVTCRPVGGAGVLLGTLARLLPLRGARLPRATPRGRAARERCPRFARDRGGAAVTVLAGPFAIGWCSWPAWARPRRCRRKERPEPWLPSTSRTGRCWCVRAAWPRPSSPWVRCSREVRCSPGSSRSSYVVFAGFVIAALRAHTPVSSCGCLGRIDTPPHLIHVVLNLLAAGIAAAVAIQGGVAIREVFETQPWAGVPFLFLVGIGAWLASAAMSLLPRTLQAAKGVA